MLKNSENRYGLVSRALHWGMALLIIGMLVLGMVMTDIDKSDPLRQQLFGLHIGFGILVLLLAVIRIIWYRISPAPAMPGVLIAWERALAKVVHSLLYLLMLAVPIAGAVMVQAAGHPVSFFGLFDMPQLLSKSHDLHEVMEDGHAFLAYSLLTLIALHFVGALKHKYMDMGEGDVMKRML